MRNTSYHHANLLASQVLEEVKSIKISVREELLKIAENKENTPQTLKTKLIRPLTMQIRRYLRV